MNVRRHPVAIFTGVFLAASFLFAALLVERFDWHGGLAWLFGVNAAVLPLWGWDKRQARRGGFRVPETALHLGALAGAVPGSLLAMRLFRHKTLRPRFKVLYGVFVTLQLAALALWLEPDWRPW